MKGAYVRMLIKASSIYQMYCFFGPTCCFRYVDMHKGYVFNIDKKCFKEKKLLYQHVALFPVNNLMSYDLKYSS